MNSKAPIVLFLIATLFSVPSLGADAASELSMLQSKLISTEQVNAVGELLYQMPAIPAQERQYEKFGLRFDRPSRRMRLTYARFLGQEDRVDIQAWGTLECLNLLRIDYQTADVYTAKTQNCQKLDALYSLMSTGTGVLSAPLQILKGEIDGTLLKFAAGNARQDNSVDRQVNHVVITLASMLPTSHYVTRYWLSPDGDALTNVEVHDGNLFRTRVNYSHNSAHLADVDFAYTADPTAIVLAEFASDPHHDRTRVQPLADQGNKAAKAALLLSDESLAGAMMGVVGDGTWKTLDGLQALGIAFAFTMEGQILGRMPTEAMPAQFKTWTPEQRKKRATELILEGARHCDHQALIELSQGFDILQPTAEKLNEFATVKADCALRSNPEQAKAALKRFADPWP